MLSTTDAERNSKSQSLVSSLFLFLEIFILQQVLNMGKIFLLQTDSVQSRLVVAEGLRGAVALRVDVGLGRGRV